MTPPENRSGRWVIDVPMTVPSGINQTRPLSTNDHWHWRLRAEHVAEIRRAVGFAAKAAGIPPCEHITVGLLYTPGDYRRRDPSNLMASQKPAVDGLVDAGVVPDDTPAYVTEQMPVIQPGRRARQLVLVVQAGRPADWPAVVEALR